MTDLKGKTILITGASSGLGKELALLSAQHGANLILLSNEKEDLELVCSLCAEHNIQLVDEVVNLHIESEVEAFIERYSETEIDILVNNAAVMTYGELSKQEISDWDLMMNVNVRAPFQLVKGFHNSLRRSEQGVLINVGSKAGKNPQPDRVAYSVSKFALRGLSLSLASQLAEENIMVKHITLGSMMTNLGPESLEDRQVKEGAGKKYLDPKDVAVRIFESIDSGDVEVEIMP